MPRHCKVVYDPNLSIQENADKCGLSVDAIRYYIRTRGIDRRYEEKKKVLEDIRAYDNVSSYARRTLFINYDVSTIGAGRQYPYYYWYYSGSPYISISSNSSGMTFRIRCVRDVVQ